MSNYVILALKFSLHYHGPDLNASPDNRPAALALDILG